MPVLALIWPVAETSAAGFSLSGGTMQEIVIRIASAGVTGLLIAAVIFYVLGALTGELKERKDAE